MNYKEAIKMLKQWNYDLLPYEDEKAGIECHNIAISALEKQIPKKPIKTAREIVCPTCGTLVGSSPYCRYCGQAIDWSDTE